MESYFGSKNYSSIEEYQKDHRVCPKCLSEEILDCDWKGLNKDLVPNTKIGKQNLNEDLLKEAYSYIDKNNLQVYKPYFVSSEGTDAFYRKDYKLAIDKLTKALLSYND